MNFISSVLFNCWSKICFFIKFIKFKLVLFLEILLTLEILFFWFCFFSNEFLCSIILIFLNFSISKVIGSIGCVIVLKGLSLIFFILFFFVLFLRFTFIGIAGCEIVNLFLLILLSRFGIKVSCLFFMLDLFILIAISFISIFMLGFIFNKLFVIKRDAIFKFIFLKTCFWLLFVFVFVLFILLFIVLLSFLFVNKTFVFNRIFCLSSESIFELISSSFIGILLFKIDIFYFIYF